MRYTKKPTTIEAVEFKDATLNTMDAIMEFMDGEQAVLLSEDLSNVRIEIQTLDGPVYASMGDFIIKTTKGEFYPCKSDIFEKTYDREGLKDMGEVSDGYHTFNELYEFNKLYNAALFNEWAANDKYKVHKSTRHSDGIPCYGGDWFIVMATLPGGQVSNHYKMEDWDMFQCEETEIVREAYDGHTAKDVLDRLKEVINK